jgi:hypothetical protein
MCIVTEKHMICGHRTQRYISQTCTYRNDIRKLLAQPHPPPVLEAGEDFQKCLKDASEVHVAISLDPTAVCYECFFVQRVEAIPFELNQYMAMGYSRVHIEMAMLATNLDNGELFQTTLQTLHATNGLPNCIGRIWTPQDDTILCPNKKPFPAYDQLIQKHGFEEYGRRGYFIRFWMEAILDKMDEVPRQQTAGYLGKSTPD